MQSSSMEQTAVAAARCLVIACAEPGACDASWNSLLRDHALVLRNHGGEVGVSAQLALAELLRGRMVERVVVVGHRGCAPRGAAAREPVQNTAAIAAWYKLIPAVRELARERAAGVLDEEGFRARLDALVQLANLEGCAPLHAARERGELETRAAVYDAVSGAVELFDGTRFVAIDGDRFAELIAGARGEQPDRLGDAAQSGFHPLPTARERRAEWGLQESC